MTSPTTITRASVSRKTSVMVIWPSVARSASETNITAPPISMGTMPTMKPDSSGTHLDQVPLVVDLDGTLVGLDSLLLLRRRLRVRRPWLEARRRALLRTGKQHEKVFLWATVPMSADRLPLNAPLVEAIRAEGRPLWLATGSAVGLGAAVADLVGGFHDVLGTDGARNLTGPRKTAALVERFGVGGFDYVGDSAADLAVWPSARVAYVASDDPALLAAARDLCAEVVVLPALRTRRLAQWRLVWSPITAARAPRRAPASTAAASVKRPS